MEDYQYNSFYTYIILLFWMEGKLSRLLLFVLFVGCVMGQTQYLTFNINPVFVARSNFYLNMLSSQLKTYNWASHTRQMLRNTLANTLVWLRQIRKCLPSNSIDGKDNYVEGANNVIIGNKNKIRGSNIWLFVSNYKNKGSADLQDSILVIDNYKIDLKKINQAPLSDPFNAISMIDDSYFKNLCILNSATSFFFGG